ncbi:MAG: helix-turn-helix domain-containing protein [Clostridia bacterium]|nr:helix-turn-helix domain-containing protein [Clostridia bacterium]
MQDSYLKNVNITVTDGGYFRPDEGMEWRLQTHAAGICKLYYIKEGACRITIEGHPYEGRPGALFFIPAGTRHSYEILRRPFAKYWMHITITPEGDFLLGDRPQHLVYPSAADLDTAFCQFCEMYGQKSMADLLGVRAAAFRVLSLYLRAASPGFAAAEPRGRLGAVLRAMENRLSVPPKNSELAEIAHMHPTHFIRYFKAQTGDTPQGYLLKLRMERAGELLRTSRLNVSEIAERLGYYDGMYFSKVFKRYHAVSPGEYRRLYGG